MVSCLHLCIYHLHRSQVYYLKKVVIFKYPGRETLRICWSHTIDGIDLVRDLNTNGEIVLSSSSNIPRKLVKKQTKKSPKSKKTRRAVLSTNQRRPLRLMVDNVCAFQSRNLWISRRRWVSLGLRHRQRKQEICQKIKQISGVKTATFRNTQKNKKRCPRWIWQQL